MLAVLAFVVVLWGIGTPSFWRDESVSVMAATMSFDELWKLLGEIDAVHALYYLLLRPFAAFGGELAARLPSALAVAGATFGIVAIGRRVATPQVGLFAGLIYAVLPMVSRYGQEARSYALVSAVAVAATWVLLGERRSRYLGYGLLVALLGWFHLYALLLLPAHAVTVVLRRRTEIIPWLAAVAGAGLLLVPSRSSRPGSAMSSSSGSRSPIWPRWGISGWRSRAAGRPGRATPLPALFLGMLIVLALLGTVWAVWPGARHRREREYRCGEAPAGSGAERRCGALPGSGPERRCRACRVASRGPAWRCCRRRVRMPVCAGRGGGRREGRSWPWWRSRG